MDLNYGKMYAPSVYVTGLAIHRPLEYGYNDHSLTYG